MFVTKSQRIELALELLVYFINMGYEYPDAQWKAASEFNVSGIELQAAYDTTTN